MGKEFVRYRIDKSYPIDLLPSTTLQICGVGSKDALLLWQVNKPPLQSGIFFRQNIFRGVFCCLVFFYKLSVRFISILKCFSCCDRSSVSQMCEVQWARVFRILLNRLWYAALGPVRNKESTSTES